MDNEKQKSDQRLIIRTQEDRSLLLKDLYGRLPYGVKFKADNEEDIREIYYIKDENVYTREYQNLPYWIDTIKPFLRPMSSMTEEEKIEYGDRCYFTLEGISTNQQYYFNELYDWLNAHHFDYRGLIEKGLVLEAPDGMY